MDDGENVGTDPAPQRSDDPLGSNSAIGRRLKLYFDELVSDEVPDRFAQLLSQLEGAGDPRTGKD